MGARAQAGKADQSALCSLIESQIFQRSSCLTIRKRSIIGGLCALGQRKLKIIQGCLYIRERIVLKHIGQNPDKEF